MKASMAITTWIGNTPMMIAQEKGFFKELGLELDIKLFDTVAQAFPAYTAGQLDGIAPGPPRLSVWQPATSISRW